MSDDTQETMTVDEQKPAHARECGRPGPCEWCDSLQRTEDCLFFENQKDEEYEGEAYDRGHRLAIEVCRLDAEVEQRFRKPNETEVVPAESEQKPVNAGQTWSWQAELRELAAQWKRNQVNDSYNYTERNAGIEDGYERCADALVWKLDELAKKPAEESQDYVDGLCDGWDARAPAAAQPEAKPVDGDVHVDSALLLIEADPNANSSERRLAAEVRRLREENEQAHDYLSRVFLHHAPQCARLPSLPGVCTQIDNLTTCIPELRAERDQLKAALAEKQRELNWAMSILASEREERYAERNKLVQEGVDTRDERDRLIAALVTARGDAAHWMAEHDKLKAALADVRAAEAEAVCRIATISAERDRYRKALEHIDTADCWNSRVTARDALGRK